MLGVIYRVLCIIVAGGRSIYMEHLEVFHLPLLPPLLSTVYQCDGCLSSWDQYWDSWLGCQVLPAMSLLQSLVDSGTQPPHTDAVVNLETVNFQ